MPTSPLNPIERRQLSSRATTTTKRGETPYLSVLITKYKEMQYKEAFELDAIKYIYDMEIIGLSTPTDFAAMIQCPKKGMVACAILMRKDKYLINKRTY